MINAVFYLIELAATFVEFLLGLRMNAQLMKRSEGNTWKTIIATSILMGIIMLINRYQLFSMWASLVAIAGIAVMSWTIYQIRLTDALVISTAYIVVLHMADFLVVSLWGTISQNPDFAIEIAKDYSFLRCFFVIACKGTLIVIYLLIVKKIAPQINISVRKMIGAVIACFFLVWYFISATFETADAPMFVIWIILLIVAMAGVYLVSEYSKWKRAKSEYELAAAHNQSVAQMYEELSHNYSQNRMVYHDLNNHYMSLQGYLKNAEYQKAIDYLENISGSNDQALIQWTDIPVLDMLLNYKVSEAKKNEIWIDIISDQLELNLPDHEITALFGNALDNAMEACQKLEQGLKWIKVVIRKVNGMTFIKISNPYVTIKTNREGKLMTMKEDSNSHGLGTKGMELIVEKYKGTLQYKTEHNIFILEIAFFI